MELCSLVTQKSVDVASKHPLYCTWRMMNYRCYSDVHKSFHRYGGLGVEVCKEWRWDNPLGFYNFIKDFYPRPEGCTLDRIDTYGNYEKQNCRWASKRLQQNNLRKDVNTLSGHLGVVLDGTKWKAQIVLYGKPTTIGLYKKLEDAIEAREKVLEVKVRLGDGEAINLIKKINDYTPTGKRFYGRKTSKYYGVSWHKGHGCWRAILSRRIGGKLKQIFLGLYQDEEVANKAVTDFLEKEKEIGEENARLGR